MKRCVEGYKDIDYCIDPNCEKLETIHMLQ